MTIRRDLEWLEKQGSLTRTHGGAILSRPAVIEFAFLERNRSRLDEKQAIAREVASMVTRGMAITLDTGTTTLEVAKAIAGIPALKVVTSSLAIASVLYTCDNIDLVLLGGNVRKNSPDLSGSLTEENLLHFRTDIAVLGADGADHDGLYTTDMAIASVSRAIIGGAARAIAVVDSSKFQRRSFVKFSSWSSIECLVTDEGATPADRQWIDEHLSDVRYVKV